VEDNEDTIRDTILEGREALMPGFKYGLTRPEIDSIIEYLKTVKRPSSRPNNNQPADNPEQSSGGEDKLGRNHGEHEAIPRGGGDGWG